MYIKIILFLSLSLIVSTSFSQELQAPAGENKNQYRGAVKKTDLKLVESIHLRNQPVKKSFQNNEIEGWLEDTGNWYIKGKVKHSRLRCATYQLGVQIGKGKAACLNVEWLTDVKYGSLQQHCNSATLVHIGGGEFPELVNTLKDATCVRVVVHCTGTCGYTSE